MPTETLTRVAFGLLVLATFAAFFVTQRLKHSPTLIQAATAEPYISSARGHSSAVISFKTKEDDEITVTVIGPDGAAVDTLASDLPVHAYYQRRLRWRGRTSSGALAPNGLYTIRVRLRDEDRVVALTRPSGALVMIRVERAAPAAGQLGVAAPQIQSAGPESGPVAGR
jgi:hypothetical protein